MNLHRGYFFYTVGWQELSYVIFFLSDGLKSKKGEVKAIFQAPTFKEVKTLRDTFCNLQYTFRIRTLRKVLESRVFSFILDYVLYSGKLIEFALLSEKVMANPELFSKIYSKFLLKNACRFTNQNFIN